MTIAYIKTEPISLALVWARLLGDPVTLPMAIAIATATAGVVLMSTKPGAPGQELKPTLMGLGAGGLFALSAIGFRGAILNLNDPSFVMAATFTLVIGFCSSPSS